MAKGVSGDDRSTRLLYLIAVGLLGYAIWQESQKQSAPASTPTAATVVTSDGKAGPNADIDKLVTTAI